MTDLPIIYSGVMVRAMLEDRKDMTRRLAGSTRWQCACGWKGKAIHLKPTPAGGLHCPKCGATGGLSGYDRPSQWTRVKPGDRLWVRESTWYDREVIPAIGHKRCFFEGGAVRFSNGRQEQAPGHPDSHTAEIFGMNGSLRFTPAIHMPRWASRLTLVITATKTEPLQNVDNADAQHEGMVQKESGSWWDGADPTSAAHSARGAFYCLWIRLHDDKSWRLNPDVVALTFIVHKCNIDQMKEAA